MSKVEKEKCFVMMPFTTPENYNDENHFDKIYEQIFKPAIEKAGYEPYRVDQNKICDSIIGKIFDAVRECPMAICDLSSRNPNVLYELGLRQAYNQPVVLIQDDITDRIFDVSGISTVMYKSHRLVENVDEAIDAICEAIVQTKNGQNKTLASIVKAQKADYESIKVGDDDRIQIVLKTIMDDIKELKNQHKVRYIEDVPLNDELYKYNRILRVILKKGITDKELSTLLGPYEDLIEEYYRQGNILIIKIHEMSEKSTSISKKIIARELQRTGNTIFKE